MGGYARLPARADEYEDRLIVAKLLNGIESGLVHGLHSRTVVLLGEAVEVYGYWTGTHLRFEVVEVLGLGAEPVGDVGAVGHGRGQPDHADRAVRLRSDVVHPAHDHLDHSPSILTQQMDLVQD